jgi:EAL domain-containing protein (putative c-di-GMP-specific phosphodiesterase class I)/response regulator of citrate/malate metabolism
LTDIRVLVVDDDPNVRESLVDVIQRGDGLECVGSTDNIDEARRLAAASRPDVAVLDVKMPGGGGPAAARGVLAESPHTRILALSAYEDEASVRHMLAEGAIGYIVKGSRVADILDAIRRTAQGQATLSRGVASTVMEQFVSHLERQESEADDKAERAQRIRRVVAEGLIRPVFQPIVDLRSRHLVGVEALARFADEHHAEATAWFQDASDVGMRLDLELSAAMAAFRAADRLPPSAFLSVNASAETVASERFQDLVGAGPPGRVVVEIIEGTRLDDAPNLKLALHSLRDRGVRFAIDDAGAGYAGLRSILELEPNIIKLDMSLTRSIDTDHRRRALAASLVAFGREIDVIITAEGVETESERLALVELGVHMGQGFLLGAPGPFEDAARPFVSPPFGPPGDADASPPP